MGISANIINIIYAKVLSNKDKSPAESYSATLFQHPKGKNKILEKIGEEATETVIAAKDEDRERIIQELSDLWFHTIALLAIYNIKPDEIFAELEHRNTKYQ